jgi:hypothetical protein
MHRPTISGVPRICLCVAALTATLFCTDNVQAWDDDVLNLVVQHENYWVDHQDSTIGSVGAVMTLRYLNNGTTTPINPATGLPVTTLELDAFGLPLSSVPGLLDPEALATTLDEFEAASGYDYIAIHNDTLLGIASDIGYWMNGENPDVPGFPPNAPALIPLNGDFSRWAVVTGTIAVEDPFLNPSTEMKGVWLDDPYSYFTPGTPPETTSTFYTLDDQDPTAPHLDTVYDPIGGQFLAVVPTFGEALVVPEPSTLSTLITLILLGTLAVTFRSLAGRAGRAKP